MQGGAKEHAKKKDLSLKSKSTKKLLADFGREIAEEKNLKIENIESLLSRNNQKVLKGRDK
jgi:2C-methyl-D-erythritol 2,4-cyclodiphosphate synthase